MGKVMVGNRAEEKIKLVSYGLEVLPLSRGDISNRLTASVAHSCGDGYECACSPKVDCNIFVLITWIKQQLPIPMVIPEQENG